MHFSGVGTPVADKGVVEAATNDGAKLAVKDVANNDGKVYLW